MKTYSCYSSSTSVVVSGSPGSVAKASVASAHASSGVSPVPRRVTVNSYVLLTIHLLLKLISKTTSPNYIVSARARAGQLSIARPQTDTSDAIRNTNQRTEVVHYVRAEIRGTKVVNENPMPDFVTQRGKAGIHITLLYGMNKIVT